MTDYCAHPVGHALLKAVSGDWRADPDRVRDVRDRLASARAARAREAEVLTRVTTVLATAGADLPPDWMHEFLPGLSASPPVIARAGGGAYETLLRRLGALVRMVRPGGEPVRAGLLGLPLAGVNRACADEAHAREEQRCRRLEAARHRAAGLRSSVAAPGTASGGGA